MTARIGWTLVLAVMMIATTAAVAGDEVHEIHVDVDHDGDFEKFDLAELADGETRTFGSGEDEITVTRVGDSISISIPAGPGDKPKTIDCKVGKGSCYVMSTGDEGPIALFLGDAKVFAWAHDEGVAGDVKILELSGLTDVSLYECPEGDTTMRLQKDDEGPFFCPKHNLELEQLETSGLHREVQVIRVKTGEEN